MHEEEPLEGWLYFDALSSEPGLERRVRDDAREALDLLEALLSSPADAKINYDNARLYGLGSYGGGRLAPEECARVPQLYHKVWQRGGNGSAHAQEQLLQALALARDPAAIPFWVALLDLTKPRDQFTTRRRILALSALALLAIRADSADAYASLDAALRHPHEQVRSLAAFYLGAAYRSAKKHLPPAAHDALIQCATRDVAFGPRYQARVALRRLGLPVPLDIPEGAYHFQVRLAYDRRGPSRTLAVRSAATLDGLHFSILQAFEWDFDHLFAFYMNNQRRDERYQIRCPELDADGWTHSEWSGDLSLPTAEAAASPPADEEEEDGEAPDDELYTSEVLLGALGLTLKHTFMYFYDFGDSHEFEVTVVAIEPQAPPGDYPRLVASKGKAPPQYHGYEDEDDEEGE